MGIGHAEDLRELIRSLVRLACTSNDRTGGAMAPIVSVPLNTDQRILDELVRIRQLLESPGK